MLSFFDFYFSVFDSSVLLFSVVSTVIIFILVFPMVVFLLSTPSPVIVRHKEENFFADEHQKASPFPSLLNDKCSVNLSIIVPAYNEENRLKPMLDECLLFLDQRQSVNADFTYEIIIVNDGSKDKTSEVAAEYTKSRGSDKVRVLNLTKNRGKGGAVRLGTLSARGSVILFADADGATRFSDIVKLEKELASLAKADYVLDPETTQNNVAIVCGSRAHLQQEAVASRSFFRTVLMYGFHTLVWMFTVKTVKDTQCGFKLFTRETAIQCFYNMHVERWAFDVELLYIADRLRIPVGEVAVNWVEIEGSKIVPVFSWLQMACDLFMIWFRYLIGAWSVSLIVKN